MPRVGPDQPGLVPGDAAVCHLALQVRLPDGNGVRTPGRIEAWATTSRRC
jgi:hypothetical protein